MDARPTSVGTVHGKAGTDSRLRHLAAQPELIPVVAAVSAAIAATIWNHDVGLRFQPMILRAVLAPGFFLLVMVIYSTVRPAPRIAEAAFYLAMLQIFAFFFERLTYLGDALRYPLQDASFAAADHALGFDWLAWEHFVVARPWLLLVHHLVYPTFAAQTTLLPVFAAFLVPRQRNAEIFDAPVLCCRQRGATRVTPAAVALRRDSA